MTRTNRSMSEPPMIPPPLHPSLAGLIEDQRHRSLGDPVGLESDEAGSMSMLAGVIVAGMAVALLIVFGAAHHHYTQSRIDHLQARLQDLHTFTACPLPPREGDALVITIRRSDTQLATRCQLLTPATEPERAGRMLQ